MTWSREPTAYVTAAGALVAVLVAFKVPGFTPDQAAAVLAAIGAVTGLAVAWRTRPVAPGVIVAAGTALLEVVAHYGWHWTPQQMSGINAALLAGAFLLRGVVTPVTDQAPIVPASGEVR